MKSIATLTMNPSLDLANTVNALLPQQKIRSGDAHYYAGGGGLNIARVLQRCGIQAPAIFPAGGFNGERIIDLLRKENNLFKAIPIQGETRQNILIFEEKSGHHYHLVMPGPRLSDEEVQQCFEAIERLKPAVDILVVSGSLPPGLGNEFYRRLARHANQHRIQLIIDGSGACLDAALAEGVFLVRCNRREFSELSGVTLAETFEGCCRQFRAFVRENGVEILVVALGAQGAVLTTNAEQIYVRAPNVEVTSPVGAGDSFVAMLSFSLAQGLPNDEVLCRAVAAAAAAVTTPGTELCSMDETNRLLELIQQDPLAIQYLELTDSP